MDPTGTTDSTAAFQALISGAGQGTARIPQGVFVISATIELQNISGIQLIGEGASDKWPGGTQLRWAGNATDPMFRLLDVRHSLFENFEIRASAAAPLATAIEMQNGAGVAVTPGNRCFRHLIVEGTTSAGLGTGFKWVTGAGGNNNNDLDVFEHVSVSNYANAAFDSQSGQAHGFRFFGCNAWGNGGACAVRSVTGVFQWYGGWAGSHSLADFHLPNVIYNSPVLISGLNSEGSARLLETSGPAATYLPITIEGSRWASNALHADGVAIKYQLGGALVLIGNAIGSDRSRALYIYMNNPTPNYVAIGNNFASTVDPFSYAGNPQVGGRKLGNSLNTNKQPLPDV